MLSAVSTEFPDVRGWSREEGAMCPLNNTFKV